MTDPDFELRLQRVLRADAELAVRSFDAVALAEAGSGAGPAARRPLDWRPAGWPIIRLALVVSALLLAAVATLWLVTVGAPKWQPLVEVVPSSSPGGPVLDAQLAGRWIARPPGNLMIAGSVVVDPFVLAVEYGGREAYLQPVDGEREKPGVGSATPIRNPECLVRGVPIR